MMIVPAAAAKESDAFWKSIVSSAYAAPAATPLGPLLDELVDMAAAPDPVRRDETGYAIFARWVHGETRLTVTDFARAHEKLDAMARKQLGEPEAASEAVFGRSFALLYLKELVFVSQRIRYMDVPAHERTVALAVAALERERDARGWISPNGWVHAFAHAADLTRALARHPDTTREQLARLHAALNARIERAGSPFRWAEEVRAAGALNAIHVHPKADPVWFDRWLGNVATQCKRVWSGAFDPAQYAGFRAVSQVLAATVAHDGARGVRMSAEQLERAKSTAQQCQ